MRDKKGMTLNEFLGVVLAALVVLGLGYGIYKIYSVTINQETTNAKAGLKMIEEKIDVLKEEENNKFLIQGFDGSEKWYLFGFGWDEKAPSKCFGSCICICDVYLLDPNKEGKLSFPPESGLAGSGKTQEEIISDYCETKGFCKNIDFDVVQVGSHPRNLPQSQFHSGISFKDSLNEVEISKYKSKDDKSVLSIIKEID